jgi:hypothetical protein
MAQNVGTNDEAVRNIFYVIFLTFERDATSPMGTLVENVKRQKSTHPITQHRTVDKQLTSAYDLHF